MKRKVRILVVEDEFVTLDVIVDELEKIDYEIAGTAMTADEAIDVLEQGQTDLAILDIQLRGKKNGIWLGKQIHEKYGIPFIFLTAYSDSQTVKKAIEANPFAYLVKPFNQPDLYTSIELALKNFANGDHQLKLPEAPSKVTEELVINDAIFLKEKFAFKKLMINDIDYIEAEKNYLQIFTKKESFHIRATMRDFLNLLPQKHFAQCHRSFAVNLNKVDKITGTVLEIGLFHVPITRTYRDTVLKKLNFFY